ncbi:MAG TPA: glycosyltransferase family 39 protein [Anaerolineae bacterium]|nr:glycosyltransferase family 39 protein [Anaerolineae bacterium]HQI83508.1 glycosyltransferase family 39 protein [Anaerolineae bacterium]
MSRHTHLAWIAILVLATALRLLALNHAPLAPDEATSALASLDAARGAGWRQITDSALLLVGNSALFKLFGGGDGLARLLPALAGVALVGLPWLWRKRLGDIGAWIAATLLLFSPLALFASRRLDSTNLGVLGALLLLTALLIDADDNHLRWLSPLLIVAGLAIGLTGGPSFYDVLLAGLAAWAFYRWSLGAPLWAPLRAWAKPAIGGLVGAILISIGLGLRWNGWSGVADGLAAWLASWRAARIGLPDIAALFLYEPLTLFLALVGMVWSVRKTEPFALALAIWGFVGLLLVSARPGATPLAALAAVVPLALLAGYGAQQSIIGVSPSLFKWMGGHALVSFIFWQPVGLALASHANNSSTVGFLGATGQVNLIFFLGSVTLIALQVLITLLFSLAIPLRMVWRGAIVGIALVLLVTQFGFAWGLAFVRPTSPAEPAIAAAASPDLWTLQEMLDELAIRRGQRRDDFEITVVIPDAATANVVRWTVRDFMRVTVAAAWPADVNGVVIAAPDVSPPLADTRGWAGIAFVATTRGAQAVPRCQGFAPLACHELARWYLFRHLQDTPVPEKVVLWNIQ